MFPYEASLVRHTRVDDASHCTLDYEPDPARWPWLCLPCWHPVVAEKYAYFSGVTAGIAVGLLDTRTFTALTGMEWSYHGEPAGNVYPCRATCESLLRDDAVSYSVDARGAAGEKLLHIGGRGVIFRSRNFDAWRSRHKPAPQQADSTACFVATSPLEAACSESAAVRISAFEPAQQRCLALLTREDGFHPGHPYHTGSGDHVNAAQLLDCVYQAAHALLLQQKLRTAESVLVCLGGSASFRNYVELGACFEIVLDQLDQPDEGQFELRFDLSQHGVSCSRLTLQLAAS